MFEVDFESINEEERRQKGLKHKRKKEKTPFNEVTNDENPFGRKRISSITENEVEDEPISNPAIPSYIPQERYEDEYFKGRQVDTSNYPERNIAKEMGIETYGNEYAKKQAKSIIAGLVVFMIALGFGLAFLIYRAVDSTSSSSASQTKQTESPVKSKIGSTFAPSLEYYELNDHGSTDLVTNGDNVYAGHRMHFRVVMTVTNPNPDEWDNIISIRVNGAKLVEDTSYMTNATLKDFDKSYQNALSHHNDIDYYKKYTFSAYSSKTLIIEFSFDVKTDCDELSIKIGSDVFSPDHATGSSRILNMKCPII